MPIPVTGSHVADAFGDGDEVGFDTEPLMSEKLAASAIAALDFVANQDGVVLVTEFAQTLHEVGRHHTDATHALNALEDAGADVALLQFTFPGREVVQRKIGDVAVGVDGRNDFGILGSLDSQ